MSVFRSAFIVLLVMCSSVMSTAQERLTISGVEYIVHEVEKGQTLFAISRAYSVPVNDIYKANPSVKGGLSAGQRLLIPVESVNRKEQKTAPELVNGELTHTVRKKETLYSIARHYNVDLADLLERNPQVANGLAHGAVLIIPVEKVKGSDSQILVAEEQGSFHTVSAGETLYSISKLYDVDVEVLKALNHLEGAEISIGSQLRLPDVKEEGTDRATDQKIPYSLSDKYNVLFLLPFSMDRNDTIMVESDGKNVHPLTDIALQFYFGSRMALDTLEKQGLVANVEFIDVGQNVSEASELMSSGKISNVDLIVGPFHKKSIEFVADNVKADETAVICPVPQSGRILIDRPNLLKVKSGRVEQIDAITTFASEHHTEGNVIIFMPDIEKEKELQRLAIKNLKAKMPDIEVHEIHDWKDPNKFKIHFQLNQMNSVIIPSENLSVVSGLLTKLNGIADLHPMTVYGLQKWADFDNIDLAYKEKLNVHLAMSDWVDRNDPRTRKFIRNYRDVHQNDPSEYAFLGYDVTLYFLHQLMYKGRRFYRHFNENNEIGTLQLPITMQSTGMESGYRNVAVTLVDHNEMRMNKVPNSLRED